ncbi:MAG: bacteriochlorophyll 4-vinyl reductase [Chlorobiales bacterium]|nr:bacteriochlorophyll 4-vinyl reductase [Chlorobiales bacterium]
MAKHTQTDSVARIGPNSIIQTFNALQDRYDESKAKEIFRKAGHEKYIGNLPSTMVPESEFHALVKTLVAALGEKASADILKDSGERTAAYLLRVRIPGIFQSIVKLLPAKMGMKLFLWAISKNAWTFAGSGAFSFAVDQNPKIQVNVSYPSLPTVASFYGGTFSHLLQTLIGPSTSIRVENNTRNGNIEFTYWVTLGKN